ncbi:hypothetical protein GALMADRAFT_1116675 [Galerina marginata CBS 339.88]|uniref:Uncharacterized protein n=1 Tax=Galerina marginata (strain CBS 339.88) TaxID=685588 RepID=A0A067TPT6_GALM3|nr:hypothetical protein GALMADRAFT_1116675 [Galerina marginata CBS 339.88]
MQFQPFAFVLFYVLSVAATVQRDLPTPSVLTAEKIYHTLIDKSPFLVDRTTTIVWTQSAISTQSRAAVSPTPSIAN